jgi:hypothetical protein
MRESKRRARDTAEYKLEPVRLVYWLECIEFRL